jgi:hypothetical protein
MVNEIGCCKILLMAEKFDGLFGIHIHRKDMEEI